MTDTIKLLNQAIVENGYRLTTARKAIVETLAHSEGHITADALAIAVRRQAPQVGRMTVYRTLDLLCSFGVVRPIYQGTGAAHFIIMAEGSHHHLICNHCHTVIEFEECMADELSEQLAAQFNFQVKGHLLEIHGVCADCLER